MAGTDAAHCQAVGDAARDAIGKPSTTTIPKVKLLDNGLLDLSETPAHLVEIVRRNATESPLLRLPAEIRNCIFKYALGGDTIEVARTFDCDVPHHKESKAMPMCPQCRGYFDAVPFPLIQVCRMVYAETAILGYALNTFAFCDGFSGIRAMLKWVPKQLHAHIEVISSIRIGLMAWIWPYPFCGNDPRKDFGLAQSRLRDCLPNLAHLVLAYRFSFEEEVYAIREICDDYGSKEYQTKYALLDDDGILQAFRQSIIDREGDINVEFEFAGDTEEDEDLESKYEELEGEELEGEELESEHLKREELSQ
ncbi:hypothetical protein SLS60_005154 [Paraconiothyrium brasiliense]|uniref:DUF7730 domain-containing protein n=1 Tax=Paraconiothyrium brasiliense TaxID=300254 RepID=A0ABR3RGJ3_9PLEO